MFTGDIQSGQNEDGFFVDVDPLSIKLLLDLSDGGFKVVDNGLSILVAGIRLKGKFSTE